MPPQLDPLAPSECLAAVPLLPIQAVTSPLYMARFPIQSWLVSKCNSGTGMDRTGVHASAITAVAMSPPLTPAYRTSQPPALRRKLLIALVRQTGRMPHGTERPGRKANGAYAVFEDEVQIRLDEQGKILEQARTVCDKDAGCE